MALQRMGVVRDYARIRACTLAVVGVGGVGAVAAEMLARCGANLILFDCDTVEPANMNRLFFTPAQCGMTKVGAARETLAAINPDVCVEAHHADITTLAGCDAFKSAICGEPDGRSPRVNLVLCCVDNYAARMTVNAVALETGTPWFESGVSEDAVSGHIQWLDPGATACFGCAPPLALADEDHHERTIVRDGVCAASLPTTMGIVAGLLVQAALKNLLGFGSVPGFLGYSALTDHFPRLELRPNPECGAPGCVAAQARVAAEREKRAAAEAEAAARGGDAGDGAGPSTAVAAQEEDNEWGIQVVGGSGGGGGSEGGCGGGESGKGREAVAAAAVAARPAEPPPPAPPAGDVDDLMAQLAALGGGGEG
jgi:ubiquitin-like modifier-activating enzyme 5